jgi:hypothetical protein
MSQHAYPSLFDPFPETTDRFSVPSISNSYPHTPPIRPYTSILLSHLELRTLATALVHVRKRASGFPGLSRSSNVRAQQRV